MKNFKNEKISPILLILTVTQIVLLLISNIIAAKTFKLFNINDIAVVMPCAVFLFPLTYVVSDIISEVYKFKWSRRVCWLSFIMNMLMVVCFEIAIALPGETDLSVLSSTWFLLVSSMFSFMVGGWVNDVIFKKMKTATKGQKLTARILVSSVFGQFADSLIYIPFGMYIFPKIVLGFSFMSLTQVCICIVAQPIFKLVIECLVAPLTRLICNKLNRIESEYGNVYGNPEENF